MKDRYEKLIAGDTTAWQDLYGEISPGLYRFLLSQVRDRDAAQDLMQEGFYRLAKNLGNIKDCRALKAWLYSTCYRLSVDWHRQNNSREKGDWAELPDSASPDPLDSVIQREEDAAALKALMSLSGPHRTVVILRIWGELSYSEIGDITGLSEGTLRSQFYWAVRKLRHILQNAQGEMERNVMGSE
jgi:RNA polymerase sigma factor (sigma-70 family)